MANLTDSIKTPFISVINNQTGQLLATNFGDGNATVVSFRYKYDDEDDDICTIKIETSEPRALDKMNIARGTSLEIVWGYLGSVHSPNATVLVRDLTSKYGNNVIYTELECTDFLTFLKMSRSSDIGTGSIIDYLNAQVYGKYKIVVKDRSNYIYAQGTKPGDSEKDKNLTKFILKPDDSVPIRTFNPFQEILDWFSVKNDTDKSTNDTIGPDGKWLVDELHVVREYMEKPIDIPSSNRSIYIVLQDIFKKCPMGPWFVSGRGDTLVIHNRDLGAEVYKEYRYREEPSLLIDLQAKTKFENFEKESIAYSGMDAKDRKNFYIEDYRETLKKLRNPKEIIDDKSISIERKKLEISEWMSIRFGGGYYKFGVEREEVRFIQNEKDMWFYTPGSDRRVRIRKPQVNDLEGISPLKPKEPWEKDTPIDPFVRDATNVAFDKNIVDPVLKAYWYTLPLLTYEEAIAVTNNRQRELAMDKEEAKIILEGDPYLMDKHVIKISNVHSQHEGFYYIKKCEHVFTTQGYKTQLDALKVSNDAMMKTYTDFDKEQYDPDDEDIKKLIEEQFKREQELFGMDLEIISTTYPILRPQASSYLTMSNNPNYTIRMSDILNEKDSWQIDEFVDRIFEVLNQDNVTVREIRHSPENR